MGGRRESTQKEGQGLSLSLSVSPSFFLSLSVVSLCLSVSFLSLSPSLSLCLAHQPPPFRGAGIIRAAACRCPGAQRSLWEGELWVRLLPSRL